MSASELIDIQNLLQVVFDISSDLMEMESPDPHLQIGEWEIWPAERKVVGIGGKFRYAPAWDLFESVYLPSYDRDVPPDMDAVHRGQYNSVHDVVVALIVAKARQEANGLLESFRGGRG